MLYVVQEGVGFDRLQTLIYYLKLPPLNIFSVGVTASHVISPSGLHFVARIMGVASKACMSLAHILAMSPTVVSYR
jgi:hypothetical protein